MTRTESWTSADNHNETLPSTTETSKAIVTPTAQLINTPSAEANAVPVFTERTNTPTATAHHIV
jgi:hypothetical protein